MEPLDGVHVSDGDAQTVADPSCQGASSSQVPAPEGSRALHADPAVQGTRSSAPGLPVRLRVLLSLTASKDPGFPDSNEDAWEEASTGNGVVLLDGATESFAARRWARLLAASWASGALDWLAAAQSEYAGSLEQGSFTWAQEAAAERGSFATIAAVRGTARGMEATCVGDTCVLVIAGDRVVVSYPLTNADEFTSAPEALPSDPAGLDAALMLLRDRRRLLPVHSPGLEAWMATDAVAAWLLDGDDHARCTRVRAVQAITSDDEFAALVARERAAGLMRADDSTIVRVLMEVEP